MIYIDNTVFDNGLSQLVLKTTRLILTELSWTLYHDVVDHAVGAAIPIVSGPSNALVPGRMVIVGPVTNGQVSLAAIANFWNLIDDNAQRLLASGDVANPLALLVGNVFTLDAFTITIPLQSAPAP